MTTVPANGIDFDVVDTGSGEPAIVFLHGLACNDTAWAPQVEDLSRDHRCIAINFRGRGATPALAPFDIEQQADDAAAILDALGVSGAIVLGHSLGGAVALLLNERRPDLVRGIGAVDAPLSERGAGGGTLGERVREAGTTEPARGAVERFFVEGTSEETRAAVREMMLSCPPEVMAGMMDRTLNGDRMIDLVRLADRKPFMTMWAERPLGDPAWVRDQTMFVRQEPVAGAGHFLQLERPAVTNAIIRAFLEEAERDPRLS